MENGTQCFIHSQLKWGDAQLTAQWATDPVTIEKIPLTNQVLVEPAITNQSFHSCKTAVGAAERDILDAPTTRVSATRYLSRT